MILESVGMTQISYVGRYNWSTSDWLTWKSIMIGVFEVKVNREFKAYGFSRSNDSVVDEKTDHINSILRE